MNLWTTFLRTLPRPKVSNLYSALRNHRHISSQQFLFPALNSARSHNDGRMNVHHQQGSSDKRFKHVHSEIKTHSKNDKDGLVVCVEGNIGCGKTTMLNYFQSVQGCEILAEPVDKWRNIEGYNVLEHFYKDQSRWGMALQTYVQLTMLQAHTKPQVEPVRLMERSIYSAKYCFVDNLFKSGIMTEMEHIILTEWFKWIIETQNIKVDLFVYLKTDPEILYSRIKSRCRKEEESIPLEYLKTLHQFHEDWLIHKKIPCSADVLVIDANSSLEEMHHTYEQHKDRIVAPHAV